MIQLAASYCEAHRLSEEIYSLDKYIAILGTQKQVLMSVGCPCNIEGIYPLGVAEEGGFNITISISGLDTTVPAAEGLKCLINDKLEISAVPVTKGSIICNVPALNAIPGMASMQRTARNSSANPNSSSNSSSVGNENPSSVGYENDAYGAVQLVEVKVKGKAFTLYRSDTDGKWLRYYMSPTFNVSRTMPNAFITGPSPNASRRITVYGTNFNRKAGGMYVRLVSVGNSTLSIDKLPVELIDTSHAVAFMPSIPVPSVYRLEATINSVTWYHAGDLFYLANRITMISPNTGPVMGGILVTITHTSIPMLESIGTLEVKLGQYNLHSIPLTRVNESTMTLTIPAHTVQGDAAWFIPGNENVSLWRTVINPITGTKSYQPFSLPSENGEALFSYECSRSEIESNVCCPPGTFGPGGLNGTFCMACEGGKFMPSPGATACLSCPPNALTGLWRLNCTCAAGFEYQIMNSSAQKCIACDTGTFRNESMAFCMTCPAGTKPSPARTSCIQVGCPDASTYQPLNDTEICCPLGQVLPDPKVHEVRAGEALKVLACFPCPVGTYFNTSSHICVDCEAGKYSASTGRLNCSACMASKYSFARQISCYDCPANSTSSMGAKSLADCKCMDGMAARFSPAQDSIVCTPCDAGTFMVRSTDGDTWCDACPAGKFSPVNSNSIANCSCAPNLYRNFSLVDEWNSAESCYKCPTGTVSYMSNNSGRLGIHACACPVGFAPQHSKAGQTGCGHDSCCGDPSCQPPPPPNLTRNETTSNGTTAVSATTSSVSTNVTNLQPLSCTNRTNNANNTNCTDNTDTTAQRVQTLFGSTTKEYAFNISSDFNPDSLGSAFLGTCFSDGVTNRENCLGTQEVMLSCQAVFPSIPGNGMLWHFGGNSYSYYGAWMGIRLEGSTPKLRVRAGDGRTIPTSHANQIYVDVFDIPQDGLTHEVVVQIGRPSSGTWKLRIWIDGIFKAASNSMTARQWTYTGNDLFGRKSSYGLKAGDSNVPIDEPNDMWPGAPSTIKSKLRTLARVPWMSFECDSPVLIGNWTNSPREDLTYACLPPPSPTPPTPPPPPSPAPLSYCVDGNECVATTLEDWSGSQYMPNTCHVNATCINTFGSYKCKCKNDTYGDGFACAPCPSFSTTDYGSTNMSQCRCNAGFQCGQEEAFYGSNNTNGTILTPLAQNLGGSLTIAFYIQPFTMGASGQALSRGASASALPLTQCNLAAISEFVSASSGVNQRVPGLLINHSDCTPESNLPSNPQINETCPARLDSEVLQLECFQNSQIKSCLPCPQMIIELGAEAGAHLVRVKIDHRQRIVYEVLPTCSCERCTVSWVSNVSLPHFVWSHVAVVQQDSGEVGIYLNGSFKVSFPSSATRRTTARTVHRRNNVVGASLAQPDIHRAFNGKLLDVTIWNTSLTDAEISRLRAQYPRSILRPEALALRKYSTACDLHGSWRCIDVDECWINGSSRSNGSTSSDDAPACGQNSVCTNSWGSFTCSCLSGFYKNATGTCKTLDKHTYCICKRLVCLHPACLILCFHPPLSLFIVTHDLAIP